MRALARRMQMARAYVAADIVSFSMRGLEATIASIAYAKGLLSGFHSSHGLHIRATMRGVIISNEDGRGCDSCQ